MNTFVLVGIGGALGSMLRYAVQKWGNVITFPYGTLTVNLAGCFLIGLLWGLVTKNTLPETARLLLITGFCGGFTTFSSFTQESVQLLTEQRWLYFFVYVLCSVAVGLLVTFAGYKLTS